MKPGGFTDVWVNFAVREICEPRLSQSNSERKCWGVSLGKTTTYRAIMDRPPVPLQPRFFFGADFN